jgi:hypothetical protein
VLTPVRLDLLHADGYLVARELLHVSSRCVLHHQPAIRCNACHHGVIVPRISNLHLVNIFKLKKMMEYQRDIKYYT